MTFAPRCASRDHYLSLSLHHLTASTICCGCLPSPLNSRLSFSNPLLLHFRNCPFVSCRFPSSLPLANSSFTFVVYCHYSLLPVGFLHNRLLLARSPVSHFVTLALWLSTTLVGQADLVPSAFLMLSSPQYFLSSFCLPYSPPQIGYLALAHSVHICASLVSFEWYSHFL